MAQPLGLWLGLAAPGVWNQPRQHTHQHTPSQLHLHKTHWVQLALLGFQTNQHNVTGSGFTSTPSHNDKVGETALKSMCSLELAGGFAMQALPLKSFIFDFYIVQFFCANHGAGKFFRYTRQQPYSSNDLYISVLFSWFRLSSKISRTE